jgi:23S rRNA (uracil1939-C5)-methyltransferase
MEPIAIKKGSELELTIESLAYGGKGVARAGSFVIFVKNTIPGQIVRALVYRKRSGYAEARPLEILHESQWAVAPPCRHFEYCGGCSTQQLDYNEQVNQKRSQVEAIFQRQIGMKAFTVSKTLPADPIYHYRNKMEFTFSNRRWILPTEPEDAEREFALGMHLPGRWDKILNIEECLLMPPLGNRILNRVQARARELKLKPYDVKTHNGFLRHLVLRFGHKTNELMVNLVTSYENTTLLKPLAEDLMKTFPEITSLVNNINTRKADIAFGETEILLHGRPSITEAIGDLIFEISANSFFQTNSYQVEKLYQTVMEDAQIEEKDIVFDLYCGAGSLSLFLAERAQKVYGFEVVPEALEDGTRNAVRNGITNVSFHRANLDTYFNSVRNRNLFEKPDVVVVDPPRAGMHESMVKLLPKFGARTVIYVSCNATTQARDIGMLLKKGYELDRLTLVDMFPHTPHIETVVVLSCKKS